MNLNQQEYKKKLFQGWGWYDMRASFDLADVYIDNWDYGSLDPVSYAGSRSDIHYSTTSDVSHSFCSRTYYNTDQSYLSLGIGQLDVRFWSSGITEDYAVTINYQD